MSKIGFRWAGSEPSDVIAFRWASITKAAIIGSLAMMLIIANLMPPLPERVVVWWDEGQCWWFNGTVEDKWIEEGDGTDFTKDYLFLVNGTLSDLNETTPLLYDYNNTTYITVVVHGDAWDYQYFNVGAAYEGYACDTVPLREAVIDGTIEFILWTVGAD